jgi:hypothetical protein
MKNNKCSSKVKLGGLCFIIAAIFLVSISSAGNPPVIDPNDEFSLPYECGYSYFQADLEVIDIDGDSLTVETNIGNPVMTDFYLDSLNTSHWLGYIDFDIVDICGDIFEGDLEITAVDTDDSTDFAVYGPITIAGKLTLSAPEDRVWIWYGEEEWMPFYLNAPECFCLGGFRFTIAYNDSLLEATDVRRGEVIDNDEYFDFFYDYYGPGTITISYADLIYIPGSDVCDIDPDEPLFYVKFRLNPEIWWWYYGYSIPVDFYYGEPVYNSNHIADTGRAFGFPGGCDILPTEPPAVIFELELLGGAVEYPPWISVGDINHNGYAFEVGDVLLLINHLLDPEAFPFTLRQLHESDVNGDGFYATVADLACLIYIMQTGGFPKCIPAGSPVTLSIETDASGYAAIMTESEMPIGAALIKIEHQDIFAGEPAVDGMDIRYKNDDGNLTVLIYSLEGNYIPAGKNVLCTVPIQSDGELRLIDASISDNRGNLLDVRYNNYVPIPAKFEVYQNYPNPFNAATNIDFSISVESMVKVEIFNLIGQLVDKYDLGIMKPGHKTFNWDARSRNSGIYFYKVTANDNSRTGKMMLIR